MSFPWPEVAPTVEIKAKWTDEWIPIPSMRALRCTATCAGQDLGSCELQRRYGRLKPPDGSEFELRYSGEIIGWWVRVSIEANGQPTPIWIGRIADETRKIYGSDVTETGIQTWVAYEPLYQLRKTFLSESIWLDGGKEKTLGWVPGMNRRDSRGVLTGNRTPDKSGPTHVYGGEALWTRYDYLEYVLKRFASVDGQPQWSLGGDADVIAVLQSDAARESVDFGTTRSIADIVRELIPVRLGLDYKIVYRVGDPEGEPPDDKDRFEIYVYALTSQQWTFAGTSLPTNPNTYQIVAGEQLDMVDCRVVRSFTQRYDRIRILGRRIVVAYSLRASDNSLVPKWTPALETEYKDGTGADDPADKQDAARARDRFRAVYQQYGAPVDWNHQNGAVAPLVNPDGTIDWGKKGDYQNLVRATLPWLPLWEGKDYSQWPPVSSNPPGHEPDLVRPAAWIKDPTTGRYVPVEEGQIGLHVSHTDWGVLLSATPNHLLAKGHFDGARPTQTEPKYDYSDLVVTLALEGDQRIRYEKQVDQGADGSTLDIEAPDCELWLLAPETVVGVAPDGTLQTSGATGRILRNDLDRMALMMCGALARYYVKRVKAEIRLKGLWTLHTKLGYILTVIEEGQEENLVYAPITSVAWECEHGIETVLRTGFAE